jgi:putative Holliday junction resolvase
VIAQTLRPVQPGRLLGIDHGLKVIGVAVCDAAWIVAKPLELIRRTNRAADFARINALIAREHAVGVVVGIPELPPGSEITGQASTVRRWVARLAAVVTVPIYLWNESLSTFEAETLVAETGSRTRRAEQRIDHIAAAVILQSFIDAHPEGAALPVAVRRRAGGP